MQKNTTNHKNTVLVITSIAADTHPILNEIAQKSVENKIPFILIGDTKSPKNFELDGCDFYSTDRQETLPFKLQKKLPYRHYARKNLGYLLAIASGAEIIIETDDDNIPMPAFWETRQKKVVAPVLYQKNWVNVYQYFTKKHIWPRGFSLEHLLDKTPELPAETDVICLIQQGLADENPDVDAIYRLTLPLPFDFEPNKPVALGDNSVCPFNSQNTTWFKEAFPLLYLPSYCSFRMTDIWRSFVAQRIAWTCGWHLLFHQSTVRQARNEHRLILDFEDEISGYLHNNQIYEALKAAPLKNGIEFLGENLLTCYMILVEMNLIGEAELPLLNDWLADIETLQNKAEIA